MEICQSWLQTRANNENICKCSKKMDRQELLKGQDNTTSKET